MHTLDRMLFWAFVRSYAIVLISLLSLYIIIDLFTNLDDFAGRGTLSAMVTHIGRHYGPQAALIFDRLSEAIALLAAVFTVAWMVRNNELLPQLSAGVSARRVIRPVLIGTACALSLGPLNQELVIPRLADELQAPRDDPNFERPIEMKGAFDSTGVHIEGVSGFRKDLRVVGFFATFPETATSGMLHIQADEAIYIPATGEQVDGEWLLLNTTPESIAEPLPEYLSCDAPRKFRLKVREADFDAMTRGSKWYTFASTAKLREILNRPDPRRMAPVAVLFHMRFTRPLVGMLMVVIGLAILLRDHNRHFLMSAGMCLVVCAMFYGLVFMSRYLGETDVIAAPFAAWLPVLIFGPYALVRFDAIQT